MGDPKVHVTGQGLGTMSREKQTIGASVTLVDAVKMGDTVEVSYTAMDTMKHASAVRVVKKKMQGTSSPSLAMTRLAIRSSFCDRKAHLRGSAATVGILRLHS